jgi:hypothetical protein
VEYLEPYFDADDTERVFDTPVVEVETRIGKLALTHLNCRIRVFGNPIANHVEFRDEDNCLRAFAADQKLLDALFELDYPMLSLPYIDRSTGVWLNENAVATLENDLREL